MADISIFSVPAPAGKLCVEPSECGTQVRITITAGGWSEMTMTLCLELSDAEAVSGMLSDAIDEVSDTIEALVEEAEGRTVPAEVPAGDVPVVVGEENIPF